MFAGTGRGGDAGAKGAGGSSGKFLFNGDGGAGGDIKISTSSGMIELSPLIAVGGDVNGSFSPTTGIGGAGGTIIGNGGSSGSIGNNGKGGKGGSITITTKTGDVGSKVANTGLGWIVHAGNVSALSPAAPSTGNGGDAVDGNGGSSGDIGDNGRGGDGGTVIVTTDSGAIYTPRGTIGAAGADGGPWKALTGRGGDTNSGIGGSSGTIGKNSTAGDAGFVQIISKTGDITIAGPIVLNGGSAYNNLSETGSGGNSLDGNGGDTGGIGFGGNGGAGGTLIVVTDGKFISSELISATGGNLGSGIFAPGSVQTYSPKTGAGGTGSILGVGGKSGSIGDMGYAGKGGSVSISAGLEINPDRFLVDGGRVGDGVGSTGNMLGQTGDGGDGGLRGGDAGDVGKAGFGGDGGKISVTGGTSIFQSVYYQARGGLGGNQLGQSGKGGESASQGGNGGAVSAAGDGGAGGDITITAKNGYIIIKEMDGYGGAGGYNAGIAGRGGHNTTDAGQGGDGGALGSSGSGGKGGSFYMEAKSLTKTIPSIDLMGNAGLNFYGGAGGLLSGTAGDGGNGSGNGGMFDAQGGKGGQVDITGAGGGGGSGKVVVVGGRFSMLMGAKFDGGDSGGSTATAGAGGTGVKFKPGGDGGNILGQGKAGDAGSFEFNGGNMDLQNALNITVNGGHARTYNVTAGRGGNGGGDGGDGGLVLGAGAGGKGGTITLIASDNITNNGLMSADGGDRRSFVIVSGKGGNGGAQGGKGGKGGEITDSGSAGDGGTIFIQSKLSDFSSKASGRVSANGGNVYLTAGTMKSGGGGTASTDGDGGDGGDIGLAPSAGSGGKITVDVHTGITIPIFDAIGGSIIGTFDAIAGDGANAGLNNGTGGKGGNVGLGNGKGGAGGGISLTSFLGPITVSSLTATGGSVGDLTAKSGKGGSVLGTGSGDGGASGKVGNNGDGGKGGDITITTNGILLATGVWDVSGGNVGAYKGIGQSGGSSALTQKGSGGTSQILGDNGKAGGGGGITVTGKNGGLTFQQELKANGGNLIGNYTGTNGDGGNGDVAGGDSVGVGGNGASGAGGVIQISSKSGAISTKSISANGGTTLSVHLGQGGNGADGNIGGGTGGAVGPAAEGGAGGVIIVSSLHANISVTGDVTAVGADGGANNGKGGKGGKGDSNKGGIGGDIGIGGIGGSGGVIKLNADGGTLLTTGMINANGGKVATRTAKAVMAAIVPIRVAKVAASIFPVMEVKAATSTPTRSS